ncbi:Hypothetical protein R9X50_00323500 [Acrodontium crateriforme]|uniref:Phosphatidylinositol N-acetylglucosaminyltransferase subunit H conserved domain-containing protein n=1 Tax=Acrodontium crateriforme TaxID=150365 RepID=A0AAQ3M370_9PEZI|nr:Hypothetical protein R9X50_00323500 [Acrodontium crateriforme]
MLSIKRPSPTTVLYTVSTRTPPTNLRARASHGLLILARIIATVFVANVLLHEYRLAYPLAATWTDQIEQYTSTIWPLRALTELLTVQLTRPWRLLASAGIIWLISRKSYVTESLLVIRGLGIQTSTSSPSYLWSSSTRFIPTSSIQDMFIHEAFKGFEVRYYLSIVIEGEGDVVVVFPEILPRREILEDVWRGARACLYEPKN